MISLGKILLLPLPIGANSNEQFVTEFYIEKIIGTKYWVAENARTTRRFISSLNLGIDISRLEIAEMGKHEDATELMNFLKKNISKGDIGVTSEAGLPGMADPGSAVSRWAHSNEIEVIPMVGPGSIYLALCASGFNGQKFVFHGYSPIKDDELERFLIQLAKHVAETGYTQIFMETPYRNDRLFQIILKTLPPSTMLSIAKGLQSDDEKISTKSISEWAESGFSAHKIPCIFLIGS